MILRVVLGILYLAMAVGQGLSLPQLPAILGAYQAVPGEALPWLAGALIAGELVGGVWLLLRARSTVLGPVWLYTLVAMVWTMLGVHAYARGVTVLNCGCFGNYLGQRLSWFTLAQDALLLVYAAWMIRSSHRRSADSHGVVEERVRRRLSGADRAI